METVLVAGANGKTGREIIELLKGSSQYRPIAMIRKEEQKATFEFLGVDTVVADLEGDLRAAVKGVDRVIFAAGSGGHTSDQKTTDVDENGAINLIDQSKAANIKKFVMLSSMGADQPSSGPEGLQHYLKAKQTADKRLQACFMDYSIVRPGPLTDGAKTNKIQAATRLNKQGDITRKDVAQTLVNCLQPEVMTNRIVEILNGGLAIELALSGVPGK